MSIVRANFAWYDAMMQGFNGSSGLLEDFPSTDNKIEIYSGTMPADADDWVPGGGGSPIDLLATFNDFDSAQNTQTNYVVSVKQTVFKTDKSPNPGTLNATLTGTAAWYAMYDSISYLTTGVLLGDVSLSGGNGSMHLDSLDLVAGQPVQLLHWGIEFTNP